MGWRKTTRIEEVEERFFACWGVAVGRKTHGIGVGDVVQWEMREIGREF